MALPINWESGPDQPTEREPPSARLRSRRSPRSRPRSEATGRSHHVTPTGWTDTAKPHRAPEGNQRDARSIPGRCHTHTRAAETRTAIPNGQNGRGTGRSAARRRARSRRYRARRGRSEDHRAASGEQKADRRGHRRHHRRDPEVWERVPVGRPVEARRRDPRVTTPCQRGRTAPRRLPVQRPTGSGSRPFSVYMSGMESPSSETASRKVGSPRRNSFSKSRSRSITGERTQA